jgi:hypothetical protein
MDSNDQIIPTEIIAILHYEKDSEGKFENNIGL